MLTDTSARMDSLSRGDSWRDACACCSLAASPSVADTACWGDCSRRGLGVAGGDPTPSELMLRPEKPA
eukprot:30786-Eustigmatos_ZCMA.PRE.1